MPDELDQLPDEKLSEAFAIEVADTKPVGDWCEDANAVLQYLDDCTCQIRRHPREGLWVITVGGDNVRWGGTGSAKTFASAGCLALIRAARAKKHDLADQHDPRSEL